jgi:D-alanyl-D-alanine dipeptidase
VLSEPALINAAQVLAVGIDECGEELVSLTGVGIATVVDHPRVASRDAMRFHCRVAVAEKLLRVQDSLPAKVRLSVAECYRPLSLQQRYWERVNNKLRSEQPSWSDAEVANEAAKYVAPPWITPPHSTGGAIDLVLIDDEGRELDMGSGLNEQCPQMMTATAGLSSVARANRKLLVNGMESAGFVNYSHEWWHFSYGDRYWAFRTNAPAAIYGGK